MTQLLPDPSSSLRRRDVRAPMWDDKGRDDLSVSLVGQPNDADFGNGRVAEKAVLDLERMNVLAALDDEVLDASGDLQVTVCVHFGLVACLDPLLSIMLTKRGKRNFLHASRSFHCHLVS